MNSSEMVTSGTRVKLVNQALRPPLREQPFVVSSLKHLSSLSLGLGIWSPNLQDGNFCVVGSQSELAHQGLGEYMLPRQSDDNTVKFGHFTMSPGAREAKKNNSGPPHCLDKMMLSVYELIVLTFMYPVCLINV